MSDLYLELRSRIPVVASRTIVGTARLQEAQDSVGLSNEGIARLIPVSEKTWRRWKEAGAVPTAVLPAVARALRLELVEPDRPPLVADDDDRLAVIERHLESLAESVAAMARGQKTLLERLEPRVAAPSRRRVPAKPAR